MPVVWQVDYEERNVTIYRTGIGFEVLPLEGTIAGGNELPGLAFPVANIFSFPVIARMSRPNLATLHSEFSCE